MRFLCWQINGVNLLTFEYERDSHSEIVMNMDQDVILTVMYNNAGQPIYFLPAVSTLYTGVSQSNEEQRFSTHLNVSLYRRFLVRFACQLVLLL